MGEPTCLMRSFSHPSSASRESKEGDPLRALTESISFGRFMSDSLAWEKWSTFSHNRYLEEVEQFSKPGSVAQKKAYFEAHYKKRAAMKAAALLEQANATVDSIPETETSANNATVDSIPETETSANNATVDSIPETETSANNVPDIGTPEENNDSSADPLSTAESIDNVIYKQEIQLLEPASSDLNASNLDGEKDNVTEEVIQEENPIEEKCLKQLDNDENYGKIARASEEKMPNKEAAEKETAVLPANNAALPSNKRQMNSSSKSSSQNRASKIPKSSTKLSSSTQLKRGTDFKPNSKNSIGGLINERRLTPKSVHMSINLARCSGETSKGSVRMSKECSTAPQNPARASIYGISKLIPSVNRQPEDRRTRSMLNKSVSGSTTAGGVLQALSGDSTKSPTPNKGKARSPIISSPFSFRSEERAAKRKEFFRKLEEKTITKEAERTHTQVKSKIPLTRPRSRKLGRKTSSNAVRETGSQLPQRPSVNAESFKHVLPKVRQSTARSVVSLPKKKAHENASPNIQH